MAPRPSPAPSDRSVTSVSPEFRQPYSLRSAHCPVTTEPAGVKYAVSDVSQGLCIRHLTEIHPGGVRLGDVRSGVEAESLLCQPTGANRSIEGRELHNASFRSGASACLCCAWAGDSGRRDWLSDTMLVLQAQDTSRGTGDMPPLSVEDRCQEPFACAKICESSRCRFAVSSR